MVSGIYLLYPAIIVMGTYMGVLCNIKAEVNTKL